MKNLLIILFCLFAAYSNSQTSCAACNGSLDKNLSVDAGTAPTGFAYTYEWSTGATTQDIDVTIPGMYDVTVSLIDSSAYCDTVTTVHTFDIIELPVPNCNITGPLTVCPGESFQLFEDGLDAINWLWSSSLAATFDFPTYSSPTVSGAVDGEIITVLITDANLCQTTCTYIVDVIFCPMTAPTNSTTGLRRNDTGALEDVAPDDNKHVFLIMIASLVLILFIWEKKR